MDDHTKKTLDKQLRKDRHILIYVIFAVIIITNIVYIIYSPASTTVVTGVTTHINNSDSPASTDTMDVLLDSGETISVKIPGPDFYKPQAKVELSKSTSVMGKTTYEFNDYLKQ